MRKDHPDCVYKASGEAEAQQIKAFLAVNGIPAEFWGESLRLVHGFTLDGLGEVQICVPSHQVAAAKELLARAEAGELTLGDSDPENENDGGNEGEPSA